MSKSVTEDELKVRATAPRVTLEALEDNITKIDYYIHPDSQLTICILTLMNGFTVTGQSACADPTNFKKDIGERIALENAKNQIWPLMGYALKQELYEQAQAGKGDSFYDRLVNEKTELDDKLIKLNAFIGGNTQFITLSEYDQSLLIEQQYIMKQYSDILGNRIISVESNQI